MTTCPKCHHANADGLKFCENCGTKLERLCPQCSQPLSPGARFCGNCGAALEAEQDPQLERLKRLVPKEFAERLLRSRGGQTERERRIVTILFSDVKGSTSMGEERDPEEVLEIMNGAFDALIEPIYRYEGTLARLMGDAILAFFGAPIAHEDDPARAILAALAIQERMREYAVKAERLYGVKGFSVRAGINTGLVVVGEVGSDLRVEYTAMGDAINVASRLESTAEPGSIVISETTARLARHAFELESLGGLVLKGKSEPVTAFKVIGPKAVPESPRGLQGLSSPLVGRTRELGQLVKLAGELLEGHGRIVSIVGEAGLGKSRLLAELKKAASDQATVAHPVRWLEGRSMSYETATPFAPFLDLFYRLFHLDPEQNDLEQYDQVRTSLGEWLAERADEYAPFLATLLGIELTGPALDRIRYLMPPDLREKLFGAAVATLEAISAVQPVVLALEDLHWADPSSLDLALRLMDSTDRAALMLIALFRPQRQDPSWRFHEIAARDFAHRYASIALEPLDEIQSRQLVGNLLEIEDLPESVRSLILRKSEGNPFFVEEVIRSLLDSRLVVREDSHWRANREIADISVPDTLAGVLTSRLDLLDDEARRVAQTAAVIGREFQRDVLQEVYQARIGLDEPLRNLQRRELIREKSRLPLVLYLFKHALTQETAYASVLMSKRRELHRRVAQCLERVEPERVNEIARHWLEAKEEVLALPYLLAAGERAARAYATPEAIGYYSRAVDIARSGENLPLLRRAFEGYGSALSFAGMLQDAVKVYEMMLALAEERGDMAMQVSAMNKLAYTLAFRLGQFPEAVARLEQAERLAKDNQDKAGLSEAYFVRCGMCTAIGDFDNVVNYMDQAARFGRDLNVQDQIVLALDHVARSQMFMTRFEEGWKVAQEALALTREIGNREVEAALLATTIPLYLARNGRLDEALSVAVQAIEIATHIGSAQSAVLGNWSAGHISQQVGDYERAIRFFQQSVQAAWPFQETMPFIYVQSIASLGAAYIETSAAYAPRASEMHAKALDLLNLPVGMPAGGTAWAEIGFSALSLGNLPLAVELFEKGLTYPSMLGYYNKPRFLAGSALTALEQGKAQDALALAREARAFADERRMQDVLPLLALVEGHALAALGDPAALERYAEAEQRAAACKLRPLVWQAQAAIARTLERLGQPADASSKREAAHRTIEEISEMIAESEMRQAFLTSAEQKVGKGI